MLPQADLLLASIERASDIIAEADVGAIAEAREEAEGALASAAGALTKLQEFQELQAEAEALQERFTETTGELTERIGGFAPETPEPSEPGETTTEAEPDASGDLQQQVEATSIPLDF